METSEFVRATIPNNSCTTNNKKSITTTIIIENKKLFKKQLAVNYKDDLRHRMAMYKEFEVGSRTNCPYIVKYIGINEDENGLYVLMEHINGTDIAEKVKQEPSYFCNRRNIEKMLKQLLIALKALHKQNIAYLDLKPQNILLTQISNDVKLTDLGGCLTDSNDFTAERTEQFAAPELSKDLLDKVDARTDIYGIGKLLQYIEEQANTKLSKDLDKIKNRCLNINKTKRFETLDELARTLNKRAQKIQFALCFIFTIIAGILGWHWFASTQYYDELNLYLQSDIQIEGIYYAKSSSNDNTCKVIGVSKWENLYIRDSVIIDGCTYFTTEISDSAFKDNTGIESVSFPKYLQRIGEKAFYNCKGLMTITLPEGLTDLKHACFKGSGIKFISFPKSLKNIGHASFAQCEEIYELTIPEGIETLELDAFANCINMKSIQLPSTLRTISRGVFWDCSSLETISIPAGVETIGEYAFYRCPKLEHVYNYSKDPQPLSVIFNRKGITLHVPTESVEKYKQANDWKKLNIVGDL